MIYIHRWECFQTIFQLNSMPRTLIHFGRNFFIDLRVGKNCFWYICIASGRHGFISTCNFYLLMIIKGQTESLTLECTLKENGFSTAFFTASENDKMWFVTELPNVLPHKQLQMQFYWRHSEKYLENLLSANYLLNKTKHSKNEHSFFQSNNANELQVVSIFNHLYQMCLNLFAQFVA